jgi:hypothetical protein
MLIVCTPLSGADGGPVRGPPVDGGGLPGGDGQRPYADRPRPADLSAVLLSPYAVFGFGLALLVAPPITDTAVSGMPPAQAPAEDKPVNPYAVGLQPNVGRLRAHFDGPVLTNREALEKIGGLEWLFGSPAGAAP